MKAKYIGEPGTNEAKNLPDEFEAYGVVFEKGKFAEVPDEYAAKFEGNSHFEVEDSESPKRGPGRPPKEAE